MTRFSKYFIDHKSLTKKAIIKINKLGGSSLIVVKNKNKLQGILSSYDLRKAIINNNILNKTIASIYNKKPKYIYFDEFKKKIDRMLPTVKKINIIPVIERNSKKIVEVLSYSKINLLKNKKLKPINASVVIMAGGRGSRLMPYTSILPKPLLPINNKPAIKHIIEKFNQYGKKEFFITLNYKSEVLKSYFDNLKKEVKKIKFINESNPLGTAGSLFYLKGRIKNNFFLTNCDTIIKSNYNNILTNHVDSKNDITIVVAPKKFTIPYGVCDTKGNQFKFVD